MENVRHSCRTLTSRDMRALVQGVFYHTMEVWKRDSTQNGRMEVFRKNGMALFGFRKPRTSSEAKVDVILGIISRNNWSEDKNNEEDLEALHAE